MQQVAEMPKLFLVKEVAEMLRMSPQTVTRYAVKGIIKAEKIGWCWRFKAKDIERYLSGDVESSRGDHERGTALQTGTN